MACISLATGCGYAHSNPCPAKFRPCSPTSSAQLNKSPSYGPRSITTNLKASRPNAVATEEISESKRSIASELVTLRDPAQWQGLRRCAVQISAVLVLANAFYSDIAAPDPYDTLENVPQDISGGEERKRIQRPKSPKAERCTQKCLGTCIRGGAGSPGEGPFNIRNLIECSEICNLIGDGDDGP